MEQIRFMNLAERPEIMPTVARWYYEEWGRHAANNSYEAVLGRVERQSNRDRIPLQMLAFINQKCAGVFQLKFQENKTYPEDSCWIGGVYVSLEERGKGIGVALVEKTVYAGLNVLVMKREI